MRFKFFAVAVLFINALSAQSTFESKLLDSYIQISSHSNKYFYYINNCKDTNNSNFAADLILKNKNIFNRNIDLSNAGYRDLQCACDIDSNLLQKSWNVLLSQESLKDKKLFAYIYYYGNKEMIFSVYIFKNKNFKKFNKKKSKTEIIIKHTEGTVTIKNDANIADYANWYILVKNGDFLIPYVISKTP